MAFPVGEFRKLKNCFAESCRAAAKQTEFSIGFDCKADLTMRLMYLAALPLQLGR